VNSKDLLKKKLFENLFKEVLGDIPFDVIEDNNIYTFNFNFSFDGDNEKMKFFDISLSAGEE
jgi:hypothetical protein